MKTNAIIRIVLFSLAIVILLGILIAGLGVKFFMLNRNVVTTSENQLPIASDGMTTQTVADSSVIHEIEVEWVAGNIILEPDDNATTITISESFMYSEKNRMVVEQSGNKLKIQFSKETIKFPSFGMTVDFSKDLHIVVPATWNCDKLSIDAAASDVTINGLNVNDVDFDGASGRLGFSNCNVWKLDIDTASGDVEFNGTLEKLDFDAASASFHGTIHNCPSQLQMDSLSGRLDLFLPVDCGFTLTNDSLTGRFNSDFEISAKHDALVHGDGSCKIDLSGLSGNVNIKKHASASETAPNLDCSDPNCTDASHDHGTICNDANCTDASHNHQTNHNNKETHKTEHH